jgi:hypothetical protein
MSEALAIVDQLQRPKGVTKRQMRLAALLPRCETAYDAMLKAGYAPLSARNQTSRTTGSVGVKTASVSIQTHQRDSARGLAALGARALKNGGDDLDQLEPRDRLAAGFKAYELAHNLGEHTTEIGDGDRHKYRQHRTARIAYYMGILAGRAPQHMVLSPAEIMERLKK